MAAMAERAAHSVATILASLMMVATTFATLAAMRRASHNLIKHIDIL
jgi:hypothetical protein